MTIRRPKTIWLLLVLLGWIFAKEVDALILYSNNANYLFYAAIGMSYLHFLLLTPVVVLGALSVWFILRPRPLGLITTLSFILLTGVNTTFTAMLTLNNPHIAKTAYLSYRESRGLPLHLDRMDTMFSARSISMLLVGALVFYAVCALLLIWKRTYFRTSFEPQD